MMERLLRRFERVIDPYGDGGEVTIRYRTLEQLDLVLSRLRGEGAPQPIH